MFDLLHGLLSCASSVLGPVCRCILWVASYPFLTFLDILDSLPVFIEMFFDALHRACFVLGPKFVPAAFRNIYSLFVRLKDGPAPCPSARCRVQHRRRRGHGDQGQGSNAENEQNVPPPLSPLPPPSQRRPAGTFRAPGTAPSTETSPETGTLSSNLQPPEPSPGPPPSSHRVDFPWVAADEQGKGQRQLPRARFQRRNRIPLLDRADFFRGFAWGIRADMRAEQQPRQPHANVPAQSGQPQRGHANSRTDLYSPSPGEQLAWMSGALLGPGDIPPRSPSPWIIEQWPRPSLRPLELAVPPAPTGSSGPWRGSHGSLPLPVSTQQPEPARHHDQGQEPITPPVTPPVTPPWIRNRIRRDEPEGWQSNPAVVRQVRAALAKHRRNTLLEKASRYSLWQRYRIAKRCYVSTGNKVLVSEIRKQKELLSRIDADLSNDVDMAGVEYHGRALDFSVLYNRGWVPQRRVHWADVISCCGSSMEWELERGLTFEEALDELIAGPVRVPWTVYPKGATQYYRDRGPAARNNTNRNPHHHGKAHGNGSRSHSSEKTKRHHGKGYGGHSSDTRNGHRKKEKYHGSRQKWVKQNRRR